MGGVTLFLGGKKSHGSRLFPGLAVLFVTTVWVRLLKLGLCSEFVLLLDSVLTLFRTALCT